jgi:hypothetical protein
MYPKCPLCNFQFNPNTPTHAHQASKECRAGSDRKRCRQVLREIRAAMEEVFTLNGIPLEHVWSFKYLGCILTDTNSDWPSLCHNLLKARGRWALVSRILEKEGASVRAQGMFYKSVVQSILLFGCETWTVTGAMLKVLDIFHHRIARCITGKMAQRLPDGEWVYPPLQEVIQESGLCSMQEYIRCRQRMVEQYIAVRPIHTLCRGGHPSHWVLEVPPLVGTGLLGHPRDDHG